MVLTYFCGIGVTRPQTYGKFLVSSLVKEEQEVEAEIDLPRVADELASLVAVNGEVVEQLARDGNQDEDQLRFVQLCFLKISSNPHQFCHRFLREPESELYTKYRRKVERLRKGFNDEGKQGKLQT